MHITKVAIGALLGVAAFGSVEATASTFDWTIGGQAGLGRRSAARAGRPDGDAGRQRSLYTLDTISGDVGGYTVTGPTSFFGSNNVLYPNGLTFISTNGIAFTTTGPTVNIFSFFAQGSTPSGNAYGEYTTAGFGVGTFTLTAVPEPSTWALTLAGFAALGLAFRSGRKAFA